MSVKMGAAFAVVCALVLAGSDYHWQMQSAGKSLGELGVTGYLKTIPDRYNAWQDALAFRKSEYDRERRWRAGGKVFLPEAPDGWNRVSFLDHATAEAEMAETRLRDTDEELDTQQMIDHALDGQNRIAEAKRKTSSGWVYTRGDETVSVKVFLKKAAKSNTLQGMMVTTISTNMAGVSLKVPLRVIGGVAFYAVSDFDTKMKTLTSDAPEELSRPGFRRTIAGRIGLNEEVVLTVSTNTTHAATWEILNQVDFDGLNALLQRPLHTVGNHVVISENRQEETAKALFDTYNNYAGLLRDASEARMRNIDMGAFMLNEVAASYGITGIGSKDGVVDLTSGTISDLEPLIQSGYREDMKKILSGSMPQVAEEPFEIAAVEPEPQPSDADATRDDVGFWGRLTSKFSAGDSGGGSVDSASVTVSKGSGGRGNCAMQGSFKKCTVGN